MNAALPISFNYIQSSILACFLPFQSTFSKLNFLLVFKYFNLLRIWYCPTL